MNIIPKICEMLGVEIGEEFRIKDESGIDEDLYHFTDCGFAYYDQAMCEWQESLRHVDLINGTAKIVKKPFEPKDGERYWYVGWDLITKAPYVTDSEFCDVDMCCHHKYCGNCFRTEAEAEKHKFEIYEKLTGKKWEE